MHLLVNNKITSSLAVSTGMFSPLRLKQLCLIKVATRLKYRSDIYLLRSYLPLTVLYEISALWHRFFIPNFTDDPIPEIYDYVNFIFSKPLSREEYVEVVQSGGIDFTEVSLPCWLTIKYYFVRSNTCGRLKITRVCRKCYSYLSGRNPLPNGFVWDFHSFWWRIEEPPFHLTAMFKKKRHWCDNCVVQCLLNVRERCPWVRNNQLLQKNSLTGVFSCE
jgi:hypothetical protein